MRVRLRTLRAGWGPVGGEVEIKPGDREFLNPLFELLRDRRALLHPPHGRTAQAEHVTESVRTIRAELTKTLQQLHPDSAARVWVEKLRAASREYLTAVESFGPSELDPADFEPALVQLRTAFFVVANHAAAYYRLTAARELADEMKANRDVGGLAEITGDSGAIPSADRKLARTRPAIQFFASLPPDEQADWIGMLKHTALVVTDSVGVAWPQYRTARQLCHHGALEHVDWRGGYEVVRLTALGRVLLGELKDGPV